jgi:nucleotide-binding universal stress UspA family protein
VKEIVVGYDSSEESQRAVTRAAEVAEAFSSHLVVVSVTKPMPEETTPILEQAPSASMIVPGAAPPIAVPAGDTPAPRELEVERSPTTGDLAERQLEHARLAVAGHSVNVEFVSALGDIADRVLDVAQDRDSDLIVVGSRERGFFERMFSTPVDEEVARNADADVLLVH